MASSARIDELRKKFEENPRRYFAPLANEHRKAGEVEQAIAICREYLPQQPGHMSGHIVYGQALYEARQFEEAKTVFETALSLDPENLIALRHLGDIALIIGDAEGARGWYRRVLEADPRNEEIQAQLASLDQAATAAPGTAAAAPTPSAPTVVISAVRAPAAPAPAAPSVAPKVETPVATVTPESPTAEVRLDAISHQVEGAASAANAPSSAPLELESPVAGASPSGVPAPPIDSFSLEGLETTSLAASAPPSPPPVPAALPDLDFGPAGRPPSTQPAPAPHAAAAPVPDLDLAEPAKVTAATTASPVADLPMLDLGEIGAPVASGPPAPAEAVAASAAVPPALEELSLGPVSEVEPSPQAPDSGPFVTETMAELYLQQGHHEEALRVYRALVEQRPGDASLRAKVSSLEAALAPKAAASGRPPQRPVPAPAARVDARTSGEPTIRDVLSFFALRRPGFRPEGPGENGAPSSPVASAAPVARATAAPEIMQRVASLGPDVIGSLFGSPPTSVEDEDAAMALALAFVGLNGAEGASAAEESREIVGAPARPAATELSLDSVFGGEGRAQSPAAPSSFSFDQFFSQRATSEHSPGSPATQGSSPDSRNDVAQFTQWLEGLKQR